MTERKRKAKRNTSFRLSDDARRMIIALAEKLGISRTAVIEIAIRDKAKAEKLDL